jgi:hypothetical protein
MRLGAINPPTIEKYAAKSDMDVTAPSGTIYVDPNTGKRHEKRKTFPVIPEDYADYLRGNCTMELVFRRAGMPADIISQAKRDNPYFGKSYPQITRELSQYLRELDSHNKVQYLYVSQMSEQQAQLPQFVLNDSRFLDKVASFMNPQEIHQYGEDVCENIDSLMLYIEKERVKFKRRGVSFKDDHNLARVTRFAKSTYETASGGLMNVDQLKRVRNHLSYLRNSIPDLRQITKNLWDTELQKMDKLINKKIHLASPLIPLVNPYGMGQDLLPKIKKPVPPKVISIGIEKCEGQWQCLVFDTSENTKGIKNANYYHTMLKLLGIDVRLGVIKGDGNCIFYKKQDFSSIKKVLTHHMNLDSKEIVDAEHKKPITAFIEPARKRIGALGEEIIRIEFCDNSALGKECAHALKSTLENKHGIKTIDSHVGYSHCVYITKKDYDTHKKEITKLITVAKREFSIL